MIACIFIRLGRHFFACFLPVLFFMRKFQLKIYAQELSPRKYEFRHLAQHCKNHLGKHNIDLFQGAPGVLVNPLEINYELV